MPAGAVLVELTREQQIQEAVQMGLAHADRKDKIISKLYYDKAGYGSIDTVYKNARKENNTITKKYVQEWFDTNMIKTAHAMGPQGIRIPNGFVFHRGLNKTEIRCRFSHDRHLHQIRDGGAYKC